MLVSFSDSISREKREALPMSPLASSELMGQFTKLVSISATTSTATTELRMIVNFSCS